MANKVFAIIYDISDSDQDHTKFLEEIQSFGEWTRYMDSTWLVEVPEEQTAKDFTDKLMPYIDQTEDYLFILEVTPSNHGWLPEEAWDWLKERSL